MLRTLFLSLCGLWALPGIVLAEPALFCGEWSNASLRHRGDITLSVSQSGLTWSNGKSEYTAAFVDGKPGRMTFVDDASVYIAYGVPEQNDQNEWFLGKPVSLVRIFYVSSELKTSQLKCGY
ncbi:hypothetical protein [uncultured Shimia sp.]|uniref:hypothetical protein n=1 Tax=uncultured Shimia sp. TaxID=573152 RepID=UPI0026059C97|nr:hypothetical protein [uncultured Shimia sp.]